MTGSIHIGRNAGSQRSRPSDAAHRLVALVAMTAALLFGCASPSNASSGEPMPPTPTVVIPSLSTGSAVVGEGASIDVSQVDATGLLLASLVPGASASRHKLVVSHDGEEYAYDLPLDGTVVAVPANMGDGAYDVSVMRNVHDNEYFMILSATASVSLADDHLPALSPNIMCPFSEGSECVRKARELAGEATSQGEFAAAACEFVMEAVDYDDAKAAAAPSMSGYVPDPDRTLAEGKGICLDYASLLAAMLRSCGIPARIVVGDILPDGEYHAWVEALVDGTWEGHGMVVSPGKWSRLDVTIADGDGLDAIEGYETHREY